MIKYIKTGIDLYSKKAYAEALKDKSQKEINKAIKEIIKESQPKSIRSDNGSEFISKDFKKILHDNNIKQVLSTPGLPLSNGNIERFNGILKNLITKDLLYILLLISINLSGSVKISTLLGVSLIVL